MFGQGSPHTRQGSALQFRLPLAWALSPYALRRYVCWLWAALAVWAAGPVPSQGAQLDLTLRIAWGGGEARAWSTVIRVAPGTLESPRCLGLAADSPGSLESRLSELTLTEGTPRTYNGVDVRVRGEAESLLTVELRPAPLAAAGDRQTPLTEPLRLQVKLSEVITGVRSVPLDEAGNQLLVRRAPGDKLRVDFGRETTLFEPGEQLELKVAAESTGLEDQAGLRCRLSLTPARGDDELWSTEQPLVTGQDGRFQPLAPVALTLPEEEGVYDVRVQLLRRRLGVPFVRGFPVLSRKLQLIVVGPNAQTGGTTGAWRTIADLNPAKPGWREWLHNLPVVRYLPGFDAGKPLDNQLSRVIAHRGQAGTELGVGGWQAVPLPILRVGIPHVVEVEYPQDVPQTLGISVVEPNRSGVVSTPGLDSGVDVPEPVLSGGPSTGTHRLIFWPRTKTPLLLLSNLRKDRPSLFTSIRVLAGPTQLPVPGGPRTVTRQRQLFAYFDKPLVPEAFSASEDYDEARDASLDDWLTFYQGGQRLTQYLHHVGYNGAVVCAARDGGAIYPSRLLEPTPKYDNGAFFATGQDPFRKDVLELLFRLFDREGLKLVPALRFSGTLPELEALRRQTGSEGITLVGEHGRALRGPGGKPAYNPLDPRVQHAIRRVVEELVERYAHHPSFAGVSIQLGDETATLLPSELWGLDDRTIARFQESRAIEVADSGGGQLQRFAARARYLGGAQRSAWLQWRAAVLNRLYSDLAADLRRHRSDAIVYLATADMFTGPLTQARLRPSVLDSPNVRELALRMGVDGKRLRAQPELRFLRPQRIAPMRDLPEQATNLVLAHSSEAKRFFYGEDEDEPGEPGVLFFHEPQRYRLPDFEAGVAEPTSETELIGQVSPTGRYNRARFAHGLANADLQSIWDGGWSLPMGQEAALRDLYAAYQAIPSVPFQTVRPRSNRGTQPLVIRQRTLGQRTYVYAVNDSPYEVTANLQLEIPRECRITDLVTRQSSTLRREGTRPQVDWTLTLPPYGLIAVVCDVPLVNVIDWQVVPNREMLDSLQRQVLQVQARANALSKVPPLAALSNPGFEQAGEHPGEIPGWLSKRCPTASASLDRQTKRAGKVSLRMASRQEPLWVRSAPFPAPRTGRLHVLVRMRVEDPRRQPMLRVSLDGGGNSNFYQFRSVGRPEGSLAVGEGKAGLPELGSDWRSGYFAFIFDEIPRDLREVRVGFDLMGPGQVWIDDVELYEVWFHPDERRRLIDDTSVAYHALNTGAQVTSCQHVLESYWSRFLLAYVALGDVRPQSVEGEPFPQPPQPPPEPATEAAEREAKRTRTPWERVRDLVPRSPFRR